MKPAAGRLAASSFLTAADDERIAGGQAKFRTAQ
jgi:hypothetical protein